MCLGHDVYSDPKKSCEVSTFGTISSILLKGNMVHIFVNLPNSKFFPQGNCLNPQSLWSSLQNPSLYNMTLSLVKVGWIRKDRNWIILIPSISNLEVGQKGRWGEKCVTEMETKERDKKWWGKMRRSCPCRWNYNVTFEGFHQKNSHGGWGRIT